MPVGPPASAPPLMACIYCLSGLGREEEESKVKCRGQHRAASTLGFLMAVVVTESRSTAAIWSPFSKAAWGGLPGASEISDQRDLLLSMVRPLKSESEGKGQEMGWFVRS